MNNYNAFREGLVLKSGNWLCNC